MEPKESTDMQALIAAVKDVHADTFKTLSAANRRSRLDIDVRGLLAILALLGAFTLAFTQLALGAANGAEIPAWAAAIVAGVTGFYFGSRGGTASTYTNGNGGGSIDAHIRARSGSVKEGSEAT